MARLTMWPAGSCRKTPDESWLPFLLLALLWVLAFAWHSFDPLKSGGISQLWIFLAVGSIGYLGGLLSFIWWGVGSRFSSVSARMTVAIALGGILALSLYVWRSSSLTGPAGGWTLGATQETLGSGVGADPLSPLNAIAAVLAVVLVVMTLIATKSAADAQTEAQGSHRFTSLAIGARAYTRERSVRQSGNLAIGYRCIRSTCAGNYSRFSR